MWERRLAALAIAVAVQASLSPALAAQKRSAAPPTHRAPAPALAPIFRPTSILHQVRSSPVPRNVSAHHPIEVHMPQTGTRRTGIHFTPNNHELARGRAVHREIARRVVIAGGVLALPIVTFYGAPVNLEVPQIGYVQVSEEDYAKLYDKLSSSDPQQLEDGIAALRQIKANETLEQAQGEPINMVPANAEPLESYARDLSEPISFSSPSKGRPRRGRDAPKPLY